MWRKGWTYEKLDCLICGKSLPIPRQSRLLYHRGSCKREKRLDQKRCHWLAHREKNLAIQHARYRKNPETAKEAARLFRLRHPEKIKEWNKRAARRFQERWLQMTNEEKEIIRQYQRDYGQRIKIEVFRHYSDGKCECCKENRIEFLSIDHMDGGGTKHRKMLRKSGQRFCLWLKKNAYPIGYRVLCFNCNQSLGIYGYCPHKKENKC